MSNRARERVPKKLMVDHGGRLLGRHNRHRQMVEDTQCEKDRVPRWSLCRYTSPRDASMLQRLSNRVDTFSIELSQLRDHVDNGFTHFEGRANISRETENFLRREQLRSERTREMPSMMPSMFATTSNQLK
jgi:hypothetical protein